MEIRLAKREPICRGCGEDIPNGTPMFHSYIIKNGDGNTYLCPSCIEKAYAMLGEYEKEKRETYGRI